MSKYLAPEGQKEKFVQHQEEKFTKYVNDIATPEAEADPILASARDRIALMAQNLYEYAPGAAVEFITKIAKNENPLIRTNIVQALANIAKPETFDLLFELYDDSDLRVKREVLRNLKILNQRVLTGEITVEEPVAEEINALLTQEKGKGEWIL
jgi:HEAT repeat protein